MSSLINDAKNEKEIKENDKLLFSYLPSYAFFIRENHLEDYVKLQLQYSREEDVPLLRFFEHLSDQELHEMGRKTNYDFLTVLVENNSREFIEQSAASYVKNQIPSIEREMVVASDITLISLIRRKALRKFLPYYTTDFEMLTLVMEEVDRFIAASEASSFNAYLSIQQEKIININAQLETRYQELIEAQELAEMGSFFWDMKSGASTYSPGVMNIFGITETGNIDAFYEHVHEDDRQKLKDALHRAMSGDGIYECEYRYIKNNQEKTIWSRGVVSFHEKEPLNMKGTIMDITRKQNLLLQLQESEEMNKQAQALTHIGNWSWELGTGVITWSDEMYRIYGLEPQSETITFDRFISLIHPDDRQKRVREIEESLSTREAKDYLMRIVNPDGTVKVLRGKGEVQFDKNLEITHLIGTCQDITREYNLNRDLEEKEEYLKQVITNAPDAVIVIDENQVISLWNPKTENIFGWKASEVLGKTLQDIIFPDTLKESNVKEMISLLKATDVQSHDNSIDLIARNHSGKEFDISLSISQSWQNNQWLYIVFIRDITNEKHIKAELQNKSVQLERLNASLEFKNQELERINKELESFNYVASHDLKEPLRKIQIFTSRILEKAQNSLPANVTDYFDKITSSASRMQLLIEDLLTFSQTTSDESSFELVDMNIVLEEVKSLLSQQIEDKQAVIQSTGLPVIKAVPFQMQQLLVNLIGNAIKYSKEKETPLIEVSSAIVNSEDIPGGGSISGVEYYQIKIKDNGIGFDQENAEKIFGLFQRLHGKDKYSGTGIGLAICKKIMHHHHGFIAACSTPSIGSEFCIYFPKDTRPPQVNLPN